MLSSASLRYHESTLSRYRSLAEVAQLVEHFPEEEGVAGSSPALGTKVILSLLRQTVGRTFEFQTDWRFLLPAPNSWWF